MMKKKINVKSKNVPCKLLIFVVHDREKYLLRSTLNTSEASFEKYFHLKDFCFTWNIQKDVFQIKTKWDNFADFPTSCNTNRRKNLETV